MFRLTRVVVCIAVVASMVVISCNDGDSPSGPTINRADLIGSWSLTKVIYTEQGKQPETETHDNDFMFKYTEDNKAILYINYSGECAIIDTTLNALNGNTISSEEGDMTVSIQGNEIIQTNTEDGITSTMYYTKYTGALPPTDWPTTKCSDIFFKKRIRKN